MRKIKIEQSTPEWLSWRRTCVTASEAAIILGVSPYCDLDTLRKRKLGLLEEEPCNQWMQHGRDTEPIARDYFNKHYTDLNFLPAVVESSEYPFLGASLDGISTCGNKLLEIKCGKSSHKLAVKGVIPPHYIAQIQHQLLVTGAEICCYFSFDVDHQVIIEVVPDKDWQVDYIPKAEAFWMSLIFPDTNL